MLRKENRRQNEGRRKPARRVGQWHSPLPFLWKRLAPPQKQVPSERGSQTWITNLAILSVHEDAVSIAPNGTLVLEDRHHRAIPTTKLGLLTLSEPRSPRLAFQQVLEPGQQRMDERERPIFNKGRKGGPTCKVVYTSILGRVYAKSCVAVP